MAQNRHTKFINLGLKDYKQTWDYQEALFKTQVDRKIANRKLPDEEQTPTENLVIFCQHPHVYTLGKSGKPEHLLLDQQGLIEKEAKYYKINRGGDITYHGPGQLVGYPIIDLDNFFTDIHKYLRYLEEAVILTLKDYGIEGGRIDGLTGVWIDYNDKDKARKICALGVKCSRWVTMHGFAFNVTADLDYFGNIVPCGIDDKAVTSLDKELGYAPDMTEVENRVKDHIVDLFEMEIVE